ncbi:MAG: hypothetical protein V4558_15700 [Gemmatimonadota bacterium]
MPLTRAHLLLACSAALIGTGQASAQAALRLSAGAVVSTPLVRDDLGGPITLKPAIAPTLAVAVSHDVGLGYRLQLEGAIGSSTLKVTDNGVNDELGALRTMSLTLLLDGPIGHSLRWQAGGGALLYRPAEKFGVFLDDSPTRWLLAAGASWSRPLNAAYSVVVNARYNYSTFTTKHLDQIGYSQFTTVQRVGLFAGVERRF